MLTPNQCRAVEKLTTKGLGLPADLAAALVSALAAEEQISNALRTQLEDSAKDAAALLAERDRILELQMNLRLEIEKHVKLRTEELQKLLNKERDRAARANKDCVDAQRYRDIVHDEWRKAEKRLEAQS